MTMTAIALLVVLMPVFGTLAAATYWLLAAGG